jgi:hypothetical protein
MDKQKIRDFRGEKISSELFPIIERTSIMSSLKEMRENFTSFSSTAKENAVLSFLSQKGNIGKMFSSRDIATAVNSDVKKYAVELCLTGIDTRKLARDKMGLFLDNRNGKNGFSDSLESVGFSAYKGYSMKLSKVGSQAVYGIVKVG